MSVKPNRAATQSGVAPFPSHRSSPLGGFSFLNCPAPAAAAVVTAARPRPRPRPRPRCPPSPPPPPPPPSSSSTPSAFLPLSSLAPPLPPSPCTLLSCWDLLAVARLTSTRREGHSLKIAATHAVCPWLAARNKGVAPSVPARLTSMSAACSKRVSIVSSPNSATERRGVVRAASSTCRVERLTSMAGAASSHATSSWRPAVAMSTRAVCTPC